MSDVTRILSAIEQGDSQATAELLPLVYDELRRLARSKLSNERADHTLQATALVHEAYLRLLGDADPQWQGRGHFFAAAAEAMRRILIEHARAKNAVKRGGGLRRAELDDQSPAPASPEPMDDILALDEAISRFSVEAPEKAKLVKLRYFAGLSLEEAAAEMGISETTAKRYWVTAKAWLFRALNPDE